MKMQIDLKCSPRQSIHPIYSSFFCNSKGKTLNKNIKKGKVSHFGISTMKIMKVKVEMQFSEHDQYIMEN